MIPAGERNNYVEIHKSVASQDSWGAVTSVWEKHVGVWCKLKPSRITDVVSPLANQEAGEMVAQMNYRPDIQSGWRVKWGAKWFEIVGEPTDLNGARDTLELALRKVRP